MFVNKALQTEHSLISHHNSTTDINNNQLFNIRQREHYCVTDELKCHNLCSKIFAFPFNTSVDSHESPTTFSCCNIISHQWWSNLIWFMNEKLFMFIQYSLL